MASADSEEERRKVSDPGEPLQTLIDGIRVGERSAVARALNLVEDRRPAARPSIAALLRTLGEGRPDGHRVGVTGPPGAGKSTLVGGLARWLRASGHTVGVLAVDPSSPRSGGALLGDRIRIDRRPDDAGLFVRSLATAGELGGLARAAPAEVIVLAAAFDRVLVETVGVGQSETDIEHVVDTVVFVVQPGSGDALQFLKAGIMEIPDIVAVNKSDLGEPAARTRSELIAVLGAARQAGVVEGAGPDVVMVSAACDQGVDDLVGAIERHRERQRASGGLRERRFAGLVEWGMRALARRIGEEGIEREGGWSAVRGRLEARIRGGDGAL